MAVYKEFNKLEEIIKDIDNFEELKSHIYLRLFNKENLPFNCNLKIIPNKPILDCAITYCVQIKTYINNEKGVNCYLIKNTDIERWGISSEELHKIAYDNNRNKNNARVETLQKHVSRYHVLSPINEIGKNIEFSCNVTPSDSKSIRHTLFENTQYGQTIFPSNINLTRFIQQESNEEEDTENVLIISNRTMNFGAVNMFFNDVTDKVYDIMKEDFYMLPLSIHEVLCIKKSFADRNNHNFRETEEDLLDMVEQINDKVLSKTFDILSYNIYLHFHDDLRTFMIK
jgi:hypothetical protein